MDFTFLISLGSLSPTWHSRVSPNGGDIRFTDGSNNQLPGDLISYDFATRQGLVAVKFSPSNTGVQKIRIWAGKKGETFPSSGSAYGSDNAYASHCKAFYPSGAGDNRTSGSNDLAPQGTPLPIAGGGSGPINGSTATAYNGTNQYGSANDSFPTGKPLSFMCMFNAANSTTVHELMAIADAGSTNNYFLLAAGNDAVSRVIQMTVRAGATTATASTTAGYSVSSWQHVAGTITSAGTATINSYLNGGNTGANTTSAVPAGVDAINVGAVVSSTPEYAAASIAFASVHNIQLSAAWIAYHRAMLASAN